MGGLPYRYTAISYLDKVLSEGLTKGEVVIDHQNVLNGVNLTTDRSSKGHGLCAAFFPTRERMSRLGKHISPTKRVPCFPNKRRVRITVDVERTTITRWIRWATKNVDAKTRDALIRSGGGMQKARTWYFSFAPIPIERFSSVEIFNEGRWVNHENYPGSIEEEFSDEALVGGYSTWGSQLRIGRSENFLRQLDHALNNNLSAQNNLAKIA